MTVDRVTWFTPTTTLEAPMPDTDLAAATRILQALADSLDQAPGYADARHVDIRTLAEELEEATAGPADADDRSIAAALLAAARRENPDLVSHQTRPERDSAALGDPGTRTEGREAVSGELGADSDPAERLRLAADLTEWAALAGPVRSAPLAAWLRAEADDADLLDRGNLPGGALDKATTVRALALADVILGGEDRG